MSERRNFAIMVGLALLLGACSQDIGDRDLNEADVQFIRAEVARAEKKCPSQTAPIRVNDLKHLNPREVGIVISCVPDEYPECIKHEIKNILGSRVSLHVACFGGVE
jgi:hypothetical protein